MNIFVDSIKALALLDLVIISQHKQVISETAVRIVCECRRKVFEAPLDYAKVSSCCSEQRSNVFLERLSECSTHLLKRVYHSVSIVANIWVEMMRTGFHEEFWFRLWFGKIALLSRSKKMGCVLHPDWRVLWQIREQNFSVAINGF